MSEQPPVEALTAGALIGIATYRGHIEGPLEIDVARCLAMLREVGVIATEAVAVAWALRMMAQVDDDPAEFEASEEFEAFHVLLRDAYAELIAILGL